MTKPWRDNKQHTHACHKCGEIWQHATPEGGPHDAWLAAHTCPNGHEVTVKYEPKVAAGLAEVCKSGGDPIAYLQKADPMAAITLEMEEDKSLADQVWQMAEAGPFQDMVLASFPKAVADRVKRFAQRLEVIHTTGEWAAP